MTFAEKLRLLLARQNLSQREFAKKTGVNQSYVTRWLQGHYGPSQDSVNMICKVFHLTPKDLLDDEIELVPYPLIFVKDEVINGVEHKVYDSYLAGNAMLHRFVDNEGVERSAIYIKDRELWCRARSHEENMVRYWNWGFVYD